MCFDSANEGAFKAAFMNYMLKERKGVLTFTQEELRHGRSVWRAINCIVSVADISNQIIVIFPATFKKCVGCRILARFCFFVSRRTI